MATFTTEHLDIDMQLYADPRKEEMLSIFDELKGLGAANKLKIDYQLHITKENKFDVMERVERLHEIGVIDLPKLMDIRNKVKHFEKYYLYLR